jgi:hypothetical protein
MKNTWKGVEHRSCKMSGHAWLKVALGWTLAWKRRICKNMQEFVRILKNIEEYFEMG